jgi:hypothetical protein
MASVLDGEDEEGWGRHGLGFGMGWRCKIFGTYSIGGLACQFYSGILLRICRNRQREHQFRKDILPQCPRKFGEFLPVLITLLNHLLFPISLRPKFQLIRRVESRRERGERA